MNKALAIAHEAHRQLLHPENPLLAAPLQKHFVARLGADFGRESNSSFGIDSCMHGCVSFRHLPSILPRFLGNCRQDNAAYLAEILANYLELIRFIASRAGSRKYLSSRASSPSSAGTAGLASSPDSPRRCTIHKQRELSDVRRISPRGNAASLRFSGSSSHPSWLSQAPDDIP